MKLGIITLTDGDNFGNCFQNYALQQFLSVYGESETLLLPDRKSELKKDEISTKNKISFKYIRKYIDNRLKDHYNIKNREKSILFSVMYYKKHQKEIINLEKKRKQCFESFRKKYIRTNREAINQKALDQISSKYDAFIVGSDQVWNPVYRTTNSDMFLCFAEKHKRIAYAASFGVSELPNESKKQYSEWLSGMSSISVRESAGKKIVKDLTDKDIEVMPDPTLLLSVSHWNKLISKPENMRDNEKYILVYCLGRITKEYSNYIKNIAKKERLSIIRMYDIFDLNHYADGPSELLYLIKNAQFVCTDSFHCTVLSILFDKQFTVFERQEDGASMGSRLDEILTKFGMLDHYYGSAKNDCKNIEIVDKEKQLSNMKNSARCFLDNALGINN